MKYFKKDYEYIYKYTSELLLENKIIGWFYGRSEYGPRALGNRSILANPTFDNKDYLNKEIKNREWWRPYAPIIMQEYLTTYFDVCFEKSPYMMFSGTLKKDNVPGITHVDNTARIQTVNKKFNEKFYNLINEFYKITGIPMLLNTSFNCQEPIVEYYVEAIRTFNNTALDILVIDKYILRKDN